MDRTAPPSEHGQRGIVLIAVLWVVTLLAIVAASFMTETRTDTRLARNLVDVAEAEALADAGVFRAIQELLTPKSDGLLGPQIEELLKLSPEPAALRRRVERDLRSALGKTFFPVVERPFVKGWRWDGTVYAWTYGSGQVLVSIQDEDGKIDLNTAEDELLQNLFLSVGLDDDASAALVDAVADFRDEDDHHRHNGAEDRDYADAGLPYGAKDAPFEAVEELRRVIGMTRETYGHVAPALTVFSGRLGIDPRVAPREALLALPEAGADEIDAYLAARAEGIAKGEPELLGAEYQTESRQSIFTIRAEARTENGAVFVREAVVVPIGQRHDQLPNSEELFQFLAWKKGSRSSSYRPNE